MALIGYARVSTVEQDPALQADALAAAGCIRVLTEQASGARSDRPELAHALDLLRCGDTLVVWRLDRLGRSLPDLIRTVAEIEQRGAGLRSLHESIDTTTPAGRLVFHVFGALAEFERHLIRERTVAGLAAARARGRKGGRPTALTSAKIEVARRMHREGRTMATIAQTIGVGRTTVYRALQSGTPHGTPGADPGAAL